MLVELSLLLILKAFMFWYHVKS